MASLTIAQVTLDGSDEQNERMRPFIESATVILGRKLEAVTIRVRKREDMPRYRDARPGDGPTDGRARGLWRTVPNVVVVADDLFTGTPKERRENLTPPLDETIGHEFVHVLFDSLPRHIKRALLAKLQPVPQNYADTMIGDRDRGYPALPEECIATWGSAALFGFEWPAYSALYKRTIARPLFAETKELLLSGPDVWTPPVPVQTPEERIAELEAAIGAIDLTVKTVKKMEES